MQEIKGPQEQPPQQRCASLETRGKSDDVSVTSLPEREVLVWPHTTDVDVGEMLL